jgi:hypothetical protein
MENRGDAERSDRINIGVNDRAPLMVYFRPVSRKLELLMRILIALIVTTLLPFSAFADDLSDARKAFETLIEYQRTDDERSPDLFSKRCNIAFVLSDGTNEKTELMSIEAFIEQIKAQLPLKKGATETYEDVKFAQESLGIRVTGNLRYLPTGRKAPFSAVYRRDADGVLRIQEFRIPVFVER